MADTELFNFFALSADSQRIYRLAVTKSLQQELTHLFKGQRDALVSDDREQLEFAGGYMPDDDQVLRIRDFEIPNELLAAAKNPMLRPVLHSLDSVNSNIYGIVATDPDGSQFLFQAFDRRREISRRRFSIILNEGVFGRLREPGLILDTKLAAAYWKSDLWFETYPRAKRVLDLTQYYRQATNEEIRQFSELPIIAPGKGDSLINVSDSWVRRKIALILASKTLADKDPKKVCDSAKKFGVPLNIDGKGKKAKLVLPETKKELKEVLRFLDEDYFEAILSNDRCLAGSKRRLK